MTEPRERIEALAHRGRPIGADASLAAARSRAGQTRRRSILVGTTTVVAFAGLAVLGLVLASRGDDGLVAAGPDAPTTSLTSGSAVTTARSGPAPNRPCDSAEEFLEAGRELLAGGLAYEQSASPRHLVSLADTIVRGELMSVRDGVRIAVFSVRLIETIKGAPPDDASDEILVVVETSAGQDAAFDAVQRSLVPGTPVLLFLDTSTDPDRLHPFVEGIWLACSDQTAFPVVAPTLWTDPVGTLDDLTEAVRGIVGRELDSRTRELAARRVQEMLDDLRSGDVDSAQAHWTGYPVGDAEKAVAFDEFVREYGWLIEVGEPEMFVNPGSVFDTPPAIVTVFDAVGVRAASFLVSTPDDNGNVNIIRLPSNPPSSVPGAGAAVQGGSELTIETFPVEGRVRVFAGEKELETTFDEATFRTNVDVPRWAGGPIVFTVSEATPEFPTATSLAFTLVEEEPEWQTETKTDSATVQGVLYRVGGPANVQETTAGRIEFRTAAGAVSATVLTDPNGSFQAELAPGSYDVVGTSPTYQGGDAPCRPATGQLTVVADKVAEVEVFCVMR